MFYDTPWLDMQGWSGSPQPSSDSKYTQVLNPVFRRTCVHFLSFLSHVAAIMVMAGSKSWASNDRGLDNDQWSVQPPPLPRSCSLSATAVPGGSELFRLPK